MAAPAARAAIQEDGGGSSSAVSRELGRASSAGHDPNPSGATPLQVGPARCLPLLRDEATGDCLEASSEADLGKLYPLTSKFFVEEATGNVGLGTTSPTASLHVQGSGGVLATGSFGVGAIPTQGDGVRMMWHPAKAAFRVGRDEGGAWDDVSIGRYSFAAGRRARASGDYSTVAGGRDNTAGGQRSTVSGGFFNTASGNGAAVSGGMSNLASGLTATVSGGQSNVAGTYSAVSGGLANEAAYLSAVAGGLYNRAMGTMSSVSGGGVGEASGYCATVSGGFGSTASGDYSFAAGRYALAQHEGSFVWADSTSAVDKESSTNDEFNVYASGGTRIFSNATATTGVLLAPGGGSWSSVSDRAAKENLEPVDPRAVLERVAALPISTWNFKEQDDSIRHMGPMAQDFRAAFGLGVGAKTIDTIDPDGVALAAIQGLNELVRDQAAEIRALQAANAALEERLARLERREAELLDLKTSQRSSLPSR